MLGKCNSTAIDLCVEIRQPRHRAHAEMVAFFSPFNYFPLSFSLRYHGSLCFSHLHFLKVYSLSATQFLSCLSCLTPDHQGKGSKHVDTCSCALLLNSILCRISGDWHVLCRSERLSSAQKCNSWAEIFHSSLMKRTGRNEM